MVSILKVVVIPINGLPLHNSTLGTQKIDLSRHLYPQKI